MSNFKPMLACDAVEGKITFPCVIMPKIDGVRGLNVDGVAYARSMKYHRNKFTQAFYSHPDLSGLDGEIVANGITHPDLCRLTTSATGTIEGKPFTQWWIFDDHSDPKLPYLERYKSAASRVYKLVRDDNTWANKLRMVPKEIVNSPEELAKWEELWLDMGFEGIIGRSLEGAYKHGRATAREGGYWRIKRYIEEEALITAIEEGETNLNEAQTNELGRTFRSSAKDGKVPSGMLGRMHGTLLKDVVFRGKVLFSKGDAIIISPGSMTHKDRIEAHNNPSLVVGKVSKFLFFPIGVLDKPRFPRHKTFVNLEDISS